MGPLEGLYDIEVLASRCRSDQSREHIIEAIRCYQAGAYRAAIVTVWIAVVFDLLDKIRELSLSGDAEAKLLEATHGAFITQANSNDPQGIKGALEFERTILETCSSKLQFFDSQQLIDLERLREDRHRCAHPSFQNIGAPYFPSAEQARLHLRNAVSHVLSLPPVQGKAALAELEVMIASDYFPQDVVKAQAHLRDSSLKSGSDSLYKSIVDSLVYGFVSAGNRFHHKTQVYYALLALLEIRPLVVSDRVKKNFNTIVKNAPDAFFNSAAALVAQVRVSWDMLDAVAKDKVVAFIRVGPLQQVHNQLESFYTNSDLKLVVEERVEGMSVNDLAAGVAINMRGSAKKRAIRLLAVARNWEEVNLVFRDVIFPLLHILSLEDVETIVKLPTTSSADLIGAHNYTAFIDLLRMTETISTERLDQLLITNKADYLVRSTK